MPIAKRSGHLFTHSKHLGFLREDLYVIINLAVRRQGDSGSGVLLEAFGSAFEFGMLGNSGHRQLGGQKKQSANDFLKSGMQFPFSAVGPMRNTREHTECAGSQHQTREG